MVSLSGTGFGGQLRIIVYYNLLYIPIVDVCQIGDYIEKKTALKLPFILSKRGTEP